MKVRVRTREGFRISVPVPVSLAGAAAHLMPASAFTEMQKQVGPPYDVLVSKKTLLLILNSCKNIIKENKGLEVIHVEARDGTFVSITL